MYWAIFGIFHSIFRAIFAEVNRVFRFDIWQLSFWHACVAVLVLMPFIPFMDWPADVNFYLAALLVALILSVGIVIQLNLVSDRKGRVSAVSIPLEAVASALIWVAVMPRMLDYYAASPLMTLGVVCAFILASASLFFLRETDMSWSSLLVVAPVGVTYAVAGIVTKLVIPVAQIVPAVLSFVLMNYVVMTLVIGGFMLLRGKVDAGLYAPPMIRAGLLTGLFSALAYLTFVLSVVYAPNPGYTSLLGALIPVWLMWYHEMRFIEDRAKPFAGALIVAAVILLVVVTWV